MQSTAANADSCARTETVAPGQKLLRMEAPCLGVLNTSTSPTMLYPRYLMEPKYTAYRNTFHFFISNILIRNNIFMDLPFFLMFKMDFNFAQMPSTVVGERRENVLMSSSILQSLQ